MDILDFAMQMELDGRKFYLKGAEQTKDGSLKKIYEQLAEEEHRHYNIFKSLKAGDLSGAAKAMTSSKEQIGTARTLFREMTEKGMTTLPGESDREVWKQARAVEEKTVKLYTDEAAKEKDTTRKELLLKLADEEQTHVYLIENILQFLKDPEGFQSSQDYKNFMSWEGRGGGW